MSEELKPCPACDYTNCFQLKDEARKFYCHCPRCGMVGPFTHSKKEAVAAWNALPRRSDIKRVERERDWLAKHIAELKCPEIARFVSCDFAPRGSTPKCIECWLKEAEEATCQK